MKSLIYLLALTAIVLLNSADSDSGENNYLSDINYAISDSSIIVEISLTDKTPYEINKLSSDIEKGYDNRIYIDFTPAMLIGDIASQIDINHEDLKRIRISQFNSQTSRVVFDLSDFMDYEIRELTQQPYRIAINFIFSDKDRGKGITNNARDYEVVVSENDPLNENKSNSAESIKMMDKSGKESDKDDTFDPDDSPSLTIEVTDKFSLGAKLNLELEASENQEDLDDNEKDGLIGLTTRLSVAGQYLLSSNVSLFAQGNFSNLWVIEDSADQQSSDTEVSLARAYILWNKFFYDDFDLQVGRQRIKDDREWIVDEELDAVRMFFVKDPFSLEFSVSSILFENDISLSSFEIERNLNDEDKAVNYFLYSTYEYDRKENVSLFSLIRQERDGADEDRLFLGFSWRGRPIFKRFDTWFDSALSFIRDDNNDWVKGVGIDGGFTKSFGVRYKPNFTIASALGTKNFRQTGLHDNNSRFEGFTSFRYYGETFDPELANLYIGTVGIGLIPFKKKSIDMVYHYYLQIDKAEEIVDSDIGIDPNGNSADIGHELDLIIGGKFNKYMKISVTGGIFFPGKAFEENDYAYFGELELQLSFK